VSSSTDVPSSAPASFSSRSWLSVYYRGGTDRLVEEAVRKAYEDAKKVK
jgi:hypothetical protein